jgi:hypothetical protein
VSFAVTTETSVKSLRNYDRMNDESRIRETYAMRNEKRKVFRVVFVRTIVRLRVGGRAGMPTRLAWETPNGVLSSEEEIRKVRKQN